MDHRDSDDDGSRKLEAGNVRLGDTEKLYLGEMFVLEETRESLLRHLGEIWVEVEAAAKPRIQELADEAGLRFHWWHNAADPGSHGLSIQAADGCPRVTVATRDPRKAYGSFVFHLECPEQERIRMSRIPEAKKRFEQFAGDAGIQPLRWDRSQIWSKELPLDPDDVEASIAGASDTIYEAFRLLTTFARWHRGATVDGGTTAG